MAPVTPVKSGRRQASHSKQPGQVIVQDGSVDVNPPRTQGGRPQSLYPPADAYLALRGVSQGIGDLTLAPANMFPPSFPSVQNGSGAVQTPENTELGALDTAAIIASASETLQREQGQLATEEAPQDQSLVNEQFRVRALEAAAAARKGDVDLGDLVYQMHVVEKSAHDRNLLCEQ